jgi:hypothetical protein
MSYFLSIVGFGLSFLLLKYRQKIGDEIGEADWMLKVGGVYNCIIILAVFIFFWSFTTITGTSDMFFGWVKYLIPGLNRSAPTDIGTGI